MINLTADLQAFFWCIFYIGVFYKKIAVRYSFVNSQNYLTSNMHPIQIILKFELKISQLAIKCIYYGNGNFKFRHSFSNNKWRSIKNNGPK